MTQHTTHGINNRSFTLRLVFFPSQFRSFTKKRREKSYSSRASIFKRNTFLVGTEYVATKFTADETSGQI